MHKIVPQYIYIYIYIYSYLLLSYQISKNMIFNESTKPIKKKGGGDKTIQKRKKMEMTKIFVLLMLLYPHMIKVRT